MVPQAHLRYCLRQYLGDESLSTAFFSVTKCKKLKNSFYENVSSKIITEMKKSYA
jgi:hypothetical protein